MIVPMKKASVIVIDRHRQEAVDALGNLGVIHVAEKKGESPTLTELNGRKDELTKTLAYIPDQETEKTGAGSDTANTPDPVEQARKVALLVDDLAEEQRSLSEELEKLDREIQRISPWGSFDPESVAYLGNRGISVRLFSVSADAADQIEKAAENHDGTDIVVLERTKSNVRLVVLDRAAPMGVSTPPVSLPDASLEELQSRRHSTQARLDSISQELAGMASERPCIETAISLLEQQIEFEQIRSGMHAEEGVAVLTGYIPEDQTKRLSKSASRNGWGVLIQDPDPNDPVPTLIKNPRWIRIIQPVFDLMGTVPGYRELDISVLFLVFFTVFFAMIIGDGGYGLIVLGGAGYAAVQSRKNSGSIPDAIFLLVVMGVATVVWGAVTGTWFGSKTLASSPVLSWMIVEPLASFNPRSQELVQWVCFILGTIHLGLAHLWKFARGLKEKPVLRAFADLGWLIMILGLYNLVLFIVIDSEKFPFRDVSFGMILVGFLMVMVFNNQEQGLNFFAGVGKGFANIMTNALDGISAFSDIISYIRLFAVGLATVEIARSFNAMAEGFAGSATGVIAAVLILFLGHTLNLIMAALSVVVHGVRLNMLEFSGHLGMEWTGIQYKPFENTYSKQEEERE
jgi:V/A-type H+/Na+-transporting ATPase subunit I